MPEVEPPAHGAALPLIGHLGAAQQQRVLFGLVIAGLLGLVMATVLALSTARRSGEQVGAIGQALMESQRLAKSATQAMIGAPQAFPEVKESSEVLSRNVRAMVGGDDNLPPAPAAVQEAVDPLLPMVARAEKNAAVVLAQQKALTDVGQSLRAINKQSGDLLDIAETVSSLKLQQGASAAEMSAMGQLVMLTQRIGKSASEFITVEGVNPEAVFLLGKDLKSFREMAEAVSAGNAELRLPGTREPQARERMAALLKQHDADPAPKRARFSAI